MKQISHQTLSLPHVSTVNIKRHITLLAFLTDIDARAPIVTERCHQRKPVFTLPLSPLKFLPVLRVFISYLDVLAWRNALISPQWPSADGEISPRFGGYANSKRFKEIRILFEY